MKTTLTVDAEYVKILRELTKEHEIGTQQEFFNAMVLYFKETGINPQAKTRSTAEELSKLRNTIISFIREQEKKKLDPIFLKMNEMFEYQRAYYKNEAITKEDLKSLVAGKNPEPVTTPKLPEPKHEAIYEEKYSNFVRHVKALFKDFEKNVKSSAFGGYTIDKAIFDKYKSIFEKL